MKRFFIRNQVEISRRFKDNERIQAILVRLQNGEKLSVAQLVVLKIEENKINAKTAKLKGLIPLI